MKNLKIYEGIKKIIKGTNYKLGVLGIAAILTLPSGCGKNNKDKYEHTYPLIYSIEALNEIEGLTNVDENTTKDNEYYDEIINIKDLDEMFIRSYQDGNEKECNKIIARMSWLIIKAKVAEDCGIEYDKINDFQVIGHMWTDKSNKLKGEYGINFKYENNEYTFEVPKGLFRKICVINRGAQKQELTFREQHFDYFQLIIAYDEIKNFLKTKIEFILEPHNGKYATSTEDELTLKITTEYNGYLTTNNNKEYQNTIDQNCDRRHKISLTYDIENYKKHK